MYSIHIIALLALKLPPLNLKYIPSIEQSATKMSESTATANNLPPNPNPKPDWSHDDSSHPGFVMNGLETSATPGPKAYYIHLEAKPGKEEALQQFLHDINNGVNKEPLTGPWFALRYSKTTFCIFEAFPHAQGRQDHDNGPGGSNFFGRPDFLQETLAYPAQLYRLDVLHGKFGVILGKENVNAPIFE